MTQTSLSPRSWLDMALLASLWGASFLSIKLGLAELPVLTLVAHRVFWAALVLWAYVLWRGFELPRGPRIWGAFAVMGLLNNAIPFGLMAWGQQFIETGLTSIFNAATAVFGVLVAAMVFADERLTPRRLVGVTAGLRGRGVAIGLDALGLRHPLRRATGGAGGRAVLRLRGGLGAGAAVASEARDRGGGDADAPRA
jgi:drug/metabolite transporter (DMT)-like permease